MHTISLVIYLDNNATTQPAERVRLAMCDALCEHWQNPSSIHRPGQAARRIVEQARSSVARLIGARPRQIVFTSGGTESLDWAIRGMLEAGSRDSRRTIVTSRLEHSAVITLVEHLEARGEAEVRWIPATINGSIDVAALSALLDPTVALVCVQWANNETGVIQPIERVGELCRSHGIPFLCDGAQWVGKMPTNVQNAPFDLLTLAAHKFHGPKGIGALWIRSGLVIAPRLLGAQESGRRAGTENVPGIAGLGVAADLAREWLADECERHRMANLRARLERGVMLESGAVVIAGRDENDPDITLTHRLWNTTSIAFPGLESEALLIALSERDLCASAGAACSSGSLEPSPVLLAMGVPERIAHGAIRFSLSRETTSDEISRAVYLIADAAARVRASSEALIQ